MAVCPRFQTLCMSVGTDENRSRDVSREGRCSIPLRRKSSSNRPHYLGLSNGSCIEKCLFCYHREHFVYQRTSSPDHLIIVSSEDILQPFILARTWSTMDHATQGRIAWNVVTSYSNASAKAMGKDSITPKALRYEEAHEYMDLCYSYVYLSSHARKGNQNPPYCSLAKNTPQPLGRRPSQTVWLLEYRSE